GEGGPRLEPARASFRSHRGAARAVIVLVVPGDKARVELVDVELAVETEVLGIGAQEALDIGRRRELVEALVLERAEVLDADLGSQLGLVEVGLPAHPGFAQAVPDLEHGAMIAQRLLPTTPRAAARRTRVRARSPPRHTARPRRGRAHSAPSARPPGTRCDPP